MNAEHADINSKNLGMRLTRISLKVLLLLCGIFLVGAAHGQNLENHQWQHRVLIIKSTAEDSNVIRQQMEEFKDAAKQMKERKLVVYTIIENEYARIHFQHSIPNQSGRISKEMEKKLNPRETFEVLLVGLDGQIKLKQNQILSKVDLFAIIDAMPMRRSEMRN